LERALAWALVPVWLQAVVLGQPQVRQRLVPPPQERVAEQRALWRMPVALCLTLEASP